MPETYFGANVRLPFPVFLDFPGAGLFEPTFPPPLAVFLPRWVVAEAFFCGGGESSSDE